MLGLAADYRRQAPWCHRTGDYCAARGRLLRAAWVEEMFVDRILVDARAGSADAGLRAEVARARHLERWARGRA